MTGTPRDHPRVGGEKNFVDYHDCFAWGSPPHGRGKVLFQHGNAAGKGITPAWAGKRRERSSCRTNRRDHPRMGGEKVSDVLSWWSVMGSPPHGRGKDEDCPVAEPLEGITPAWAGKRVSVIGHNSNQRDHPRVGGEKLTAFWLVGFASGSPPHGRGKVGAVDLSGQGGRITPARRGKGTGR